jgi:hypothetical protein
MPVRGEAGADSGKAEVIQNCGDCLHSGPAMPSCSQNAMLGASNSCWTDLQESGRAR